MHRTITRYGTRSLNDPEVLEDVQFLYDLGVPNDEIARRCNVGLAALDKKYGKRKSI